MSRWNPYLKNDLIWNSIQFKSNQTRKTLTNKHAHTRIHTLTSTRTHRSASAENEQTSKQLQQSIDSSTTTTTTNNNNNNIIIINNNKNITQNVDARMFYHSHLLTISSFLFLQIYANAWNIEMLLMLALLTCSLACSLVFCLFVCLLTNYASKNITAIAIVIEWGEELKKSDVALHSASFCFAEN